MGVFTPFNFFLMKFNWNINYIKCLEFWLNLSQWAVMDMMMNLSTWAEWKEINWEIYYYLSASKLVEELPLISDKKNTFLVILKVLKEKWLIDSILDSNKSRYKVTQKWKSFLFEVFQGVEKNQDKSWKKSRLGVEKNQDNNNTSYNNTRINKNNNISKDILLQKTSEDDEKRNLKSEVDEMLLDYKFLEALEKKFNRDIEFLKSSAGDFLIFWTAKNPNWIKELWETKKVFDTKRRFYTRLKNSESRSQNRTNNKWIWITTV